MEVTELRIGNFLERSLKSGRGRKVFDRINFLDLRRIHDNIGCFNFFPIPLTEEWLLKFGFTNYENESWFWSFDFNSKQETFKVFQLTANGEPFGLWGLVGCPQLMKKIEFVHQLQNLYFALTGEELLIK